MPTYEYECDACQHQFEEFQNLSDDPLTKCPKCKKKKLRRLFSTGGGLIFKGSGFYITDYRSDSYKKGASGDSSSSSSSSTESKSSDSKSSSKSTSKSKNSSKSKD
ncbi:FmdB family zinc ribbon protein [Blastopirellula retiformator]|uniref:Zinc ribbon domain protein n=1 Tax=Blastopirellula retiformator TaxID=2527970 RepID=A0A5C5UVJ8_9BACT|nr:FmdB family zinc ribbon protein [Blastopirellula retiformator]TWT29859.1 Zinc ribbon domain protein [Blastopirellula retiformator]